jgi:outer membrane biosynthesis protein TonB
MFEESNEAPFSSTEILTFAGILSSMQAIGRQTQCVALLVCFPQTKGRNKRREEKRRKEKKKKKERKKKKKKKKKREQRKKKRKASKKRKEKKKNEKNKKPVDLFT